MVTFVKIGHQTIGNGVQLYTMLRLFRFLKPYRIPVACVLFLVFLQTIAELFLPTLMASIVDTGIVHGDISHIIKIGSVMIGVAACGVVFSVVASFLSARVSAGFGRRVRGKVFSRVGHFTLQQFDQIGTASLITRTTNDINQVQQVLMMMMRMAVMAPMMCIGGIIMAISQDTQLSWVIVVVIPILTMAIFVIVRKSTPMFKAMQVKIDKLNLVLREALTGVRVIRSFNRTEHEKQRFDQANSDLTNTAIKVNQLMASMMPIMMIVMNFSTIAIIWFGGIRIDNGDMQVGSLMAFIQYAMQIMFSLMMVSMIMVTIPRASASAIRINEVLDLTSDMPDRAVGGNDSVDTVPLTEQERGIIEFKEVTFSYPGAETPALSNISFRTQPGEVTAIIGGTGSGKSTLISLIPRFYDVDSGEITIGGQDIRDMTEEQLRAKIGFVAQNAVLFTGTIAENIRYGKEDATDEEVAHAAQIAQADDFISALQQKYDSTITQGGKNLSGGQKQRLSIARALVRKPEIYIFDDSFSALDFKTDAKLRQALKAETGQSTVFIVAQRVSTIIDADQIIVLDEGEIAGIGTHRSLMKTCTVYREIVSSQLSEEEIA